MLNLNTLLSKCFNKFNYLNKTIRTVNSEARMELKQVVKRLNEYGDLKIACDWDNVGLLGSERGFASFLSPNYYGYNLFSS